MVGATNEEKSCCRTVGWGSIGEVGVDGIAFVRVYGAADKWFMPVTMVQETKGYMTIHLVLKLNWSACCKKKKVIHCRYVRPCKRSV